MLPRYRAVVFVHGCFWHGHSDCEAATLPTTNVEYWSAKIKRNKDRDGRVASELRDQGWLVIVVWECTTRARESLGPRLNRELEGRRR